MPYEPDTKIGGAADRFPSTERSLLTSHAADPIGQEAASRIIAIYWKPAYKYIRVRWRRSNEDAKDLVQGFFGTVLEQDILAKFDSSKARFRTYLQVCLDRFVMKQDQRAGRLKRGGRALTLDFGSAEREIENWSKTSCAESAEELFLREWRRETFALALQDLRTECYRGGRELQHRIFEAYDLAEGVRPSYAEMALKHQLAMSTVTNYLAWSRRELRRLALERLASSNPNGRASRDESRLLFAG